MKTKDFKESDVILINKFSNELLWFGWMMDLNETLSSVSDLSQLWFRELYLEVSKRVQVIIGDSSLFSEPFTKPHK